MSKNLVIVESPAKAKTIEKFLGSEYKVMSSYGHIRDLIKNDFSIDIEHGFRPIYVIPEEKNELVEKLRKAAQQAETVWLASDEDREGEAIAWHLYEVLGLKPEHTRRIVFHEITKPAILQAIKQPRDIDLNLVDAQQARRVLDRIVGFELSPVLWQKILRGLSAGRVQSVAVRLVAEREKEIQNFHSEPYYRLVGQFGSTDGHSFPAELTHRVAERDQVMRLLESYREATFKVDNITVKPVKKSPAPPFTTSTLQQEAARKLGFSVSQTMRVAQALYEAGHITYMRTDSVNLSSLALGTISDEIKEHIGEKYLRVRRYHTVSKGAQEAHEAIRPTYISKHEISGTAQEKKLYNLIWKRTIASQMADAELERTTVDIAASQQNVADDAKFQATGEVVKFDGFLKVYFESTDDEQAAPDDMLTLPAMKKGQTLDLVEMTATQRFTQQPNRFTEASLVRRLEELGIGRPSTYAPTISIIQQREYVIRGENKGEKRNYEVIKLANGKISSTTKSEVFGSDKGRLIPTDVGMVVNDFLLEYFPTILDYNFTANVEKSFDDIAAGKDQWNTDIERFYEKFHPNVEHVQEMHFEHKPGERFLGNDPATGKPVYAKIGRYGRVVQLGSSEDEEKPRFASLLPGQWITTITLEQALKLFDLPRVLGKFENEDVTVAIGRFGPYVKNGKTFVSIPKDTPPTAVTLEQAIEMIVGKRNAEAQKVILEFEQRPGLQVLNGRYGPYICYDKQNYRIPRGTDANTLTLEQCLDIVNDEANASHSRRARAAKSAAKTPSRRTGKKAK